MPEFSVQFWTMIVLALIVGAVFMFSSWARHLFAIGGNENAARLTGVPVNRIKFQAYVFCAFCASIAALQLLGYSGSAINALGTGWDLLLPRPYKDGGRAVDRWEIPGLKSAVHVDGTINDPRDTDRGWSVELAFPWAVLGELARRNCTSAIVSQDLQQSFLQIVGVHSLPP